MKSSTIGSNSNQTVDMPTSSATRIHRFLLPMLFVSIFLAYSGSLGYEFVYDDRDQILQNRYLTSWSYFPRYFTEHLWSHRDFNLPGNYYRPLFLVWLRLCRSILGVNTTWWHLVTLLTYIASVAVVYWMARRLLKDRLTAVIAAMIFGLCPLHIEAAAWPSGVNEPLLALLFIPSFMLYLKSRDSETEGDRNARWKYLASSVLVYALALFSKETAVILPLMIAAYELICGTKQKPEALPMRPRLRLFIEDSVRALARISPFLIATAVYLVIRSIVLGGLVYTPWKVPLLTRLLTIPSLLLGYIRLLLWPVGLSEFYDTPYVEQAGVRNLFLPLAAVSLAACLLWWAVSRISDFRDRRVMAFACAWLVIPIVPVLNIAAFREGDSLHDRYLFLPTVGLSLLVSYGLRKIRFGTGQLAGIPSGQALAALALAAALGLATAYQHVDWANDLVLFHHSLSVAPGNVIALNSFGDALSRGERYDEAIAVFESLVQRDPRNATSQYNLGYNYYKVGRYGEAVPHLATAVSINPKDERQYLALGVTLFYLDKYGVAEQALREGIKLRRERLGLHYALGAVLKVTGRLDEALYEFNQELVYNPDYASAYDQIEDIKRQIQNGAIKQTSQSSK